MQYKSYSCIFIALCIINQHKYVSNVLRPGFHHHKNPLYGFQKYSIYLAHLGLFFLHRFGFFVLFFQSNPADSVHELFSAQSLTAHLHMSKLSAVFLCQDTHWSMALITATAACPSVQTVRTHTHTQKFPQETAITRSGTLTTALLSLASVSSDAGEDEMQEEGCLNLDTTRVP